MVSFLQVSVCKPAPER